VSSTAPRSVLTVDGLTVVYGKHAVLQDISFSLEHGVRVAVVGPNGAGKSTLLRAIAGLVKPSTGSVKRPTGSQGQSADIALLPQRAQVDWSFPATVFDVVMMGRTAKLGLFRRPGPKDRERVSRALKLVGLDDLADRPLAELSGGQQQRMFIARAVVQEARLLLMDEPFVGLDAPARDVVQQIIDVLGSRGIAIMIATHDLTQARERSDFVILLNRWLYALGAPDEVLTRKPLAPAYGGEYAFA